MKNKREETIKTIDLLVAGRHTVKAKSAIALWTKRHTSISDFEKALDWMFKLGLYEYGYRVLAKKMDTSLGVELRTLQFWSVRYLNAMGASSFSLKILDRLSAKTDYEWRLASGVWLANFNYKLAKSAQVNWVSKALNPEVTNPMSVLVISDCDAQLDKLNKAKELAKRVFSLTPKTINRAIAAQAIGEYYCYEDDFKSALIWLERARDMFAKNDSTPDYLIFLKWYGFALAHSSFKKNGIKMMDKAILLMRKNRMRDEAWLLTLVLKAQINPTKRLNHTLNRVFHFPGLSPLLLKNLKANQKLTNMWSTIYQISTGAEYLVDLSSSEYKKGNLWSPWLPLELKLAGYLRVVENWGLSPIRLIELLWPNEAITPPHLLKARLEQLVHRLRMAYKINVRQISGRYFLKESEYRKIDVYIGENIPQFLKRHNQFYAKDMGDFYKISNAHRTRILNTWSEQGLIKKNLDKKGHYLHVN